MFNELFVKRNKNGTWTVTDRNGNSVTAVTKQMATNLYNARYGADILPKSYNYDMSEIVNSTHIDGIN